MGRVEATPSFSGRITATDDPVIVLTKAMIAGAPRDVLSLAQGIVHWQPPEMALESGRELFATPAAHQYGPDEGMPALREALAGKLAAENGLPDHDVMVTAGANQAYANAVLALVDAGDRAVLFAPYYFNHHMALTMTGADVVLGPRDPATMVTAPGLGPGGPRARPRPRARRPPRRGRPRDGDREPPPAPPGPAPQHPDLDWLERELLGSADPPRLVTIVNPCNPTGTLLSRGECERAARLCAAAGAWLVVDNTYEHFAYPDDAGVPRRHHCVAGDHVVHVFSFSKAFGMMGWRCGYLAYPRGGAGRLGRELLKAQDTIPICPPQVSQAVALGAVRAGRGWVEGMVRGLGANRRAVLDALSPLGAPGDGVYGGEGAIYLWARLPPGCEALDLAVARWLVDVHGVCVIPGSACGSPGHVRVAYANLPPDQCAAAAARLRAGLEELRDRGAPAVAGFA